MPAKDPLSGSDESFERLLTGVLSQVTDPTLAAAAEAWRAARLAADVARVAAEGATGRKREARTHAARLLRSKIRQLRADPAVTDAVIARAGLKPLDRTPTRAAVPSGSPTLIVDPAGRFRHKIVFFVAGSESRKKPRGVMGMELWLMSPDVGGAGAGEKSSDWTFVDVLTRSPHIRTVGLAGGKMAHWRGRWRNTRGETGPWSEVVECTVMG